MHFLMQNHLSSVQAQFAGSSSSSVKLFMEMPIYSTLQVEVRTVRTKNIPQKKYLSSPFFAKCIAYNILPGTNFQQIFLRFL